MREMQTKTALKIYLVHFRMIKTNNTRDSSCWQGCKEGNHYHVAGRGFNLQNHYGNQCGREISLGSRIDSYGWMGTGGASKEERRRA